MRKRLVVSTLLVAVVSVLLLGVPLGLVATRLIGDEAQARINREATQVAGRVDGFAHEHRAMTSQDVAGLAASDRYLEIRTPAQTLTAGEHVNGSALKGSAVGSSGERVTIYASDADTTRQTATVWLVVAGLAVVSLGAAVGLALAQAKRLGGPLEELAQAAERIGSGDSRPAGRRFGVPEIDKVGRVLDRSAERIAALLGSERALAADISHQLRTPLTALSIRLEEIIATAANPDVKEEAAAALAAAERLAGVVDALLAAHAKSARTATVELVDLDGVLDQQRREWEPAFRRAGRDLDIAGRRGLKVTATPGVLAQVVATLIDNALSHGAGPVVLRTRHFGAHVVVEVGDQGRGVPDVVVPHIFERSFSGSSSTGLGLSLARDLIESDGGRLELTQPRPPVFAIFLTPAADS